MVRATGFLLLFPIACATAASVGGAPDAVSPAQTEYLEVQRVFDANCTTCHSGAAARAGLRLDTWEHIVAGSDRGAVVIPFDPHGSLLLAMTAEREAHPSTVLDDSEIALISRWVVHGARNADGDLPPHSDQLLYVANQSSATISVIDMETDMVVRTVDLQGLGFPADAKPHHVVVEPDGSHWYVSLIAANTVLKFDRANEIVGRLEFERPGMMALDPASDALYVGRSMAAVNPPQRIGVVTRSTMELEEIDVFFARPHAIAIGPLGMNVFVASLAVNQIATVSPFEEAAELTTLEGTAPHVFVQFAVSPTEDLMVGTAQLTSKLFIFDLDRVPDMTPVDTIEVNQAPWHPVFTPDGRWVFFGNMETSTVTVVDVENRTVAAVIEGNGLAQPHGSAVSPDGSKIYISNRNLRGEYSPRHDLAGNAQAGTVVVIDVATREITGIIEVGAYPAGIGTRTPVTR